MLEELFPVLFFFVAYYWRGIYFATAGMLLIFIGQLFVKKIRHRKISTFNMVNFVVLVFLGTMTLYLKNEWFIKCKPSVLYWSMAFGLIVHCKIKKETFIKKLFSDYFVISEPIYWRYLHWSWVIFLFGLGILNLWIAYCLPTKVWVNFKLFGLFGLIFIFLLLQVVILNSKKLLQFQQNKKN